MEQNQANEQIVEKKSNSHERLILFVVILVIVAIGVAFYFEREFFLSFFDDTEEEIQDDINVEENNSTTETNSTQGLRVYYNKEAFCMKESEDCVEYITIKTETNNIKLLDTEDKKYVVYRDGDIVKIYDADKKSSIVTDMDLKENCQICRFEEDPVSHKVSGVTYREKSTDFFSYYSFKLGKTIYKNKYYELDQIDDKYLSGTLVTCVEDYNCNPVGADLLSIDEEKIVMSSERNVIDSFYLNYGVLRSNNNRFYLLIISEDANLYYKIYNKDLKEILSFDINNMPNETNLDINEQGQLYVINGKFVDVYDTNGKMIKRSKSFDKVFQIIGDYIVVEKNGKLVITTVDGKKEIDMCEWNNDKIMHTGLSGWYTENGKNGIYLVVEDPKVTIDEVWNYYKNLPEDDRDIESKEDLKSVDLGYEYYYIPTTGEVGKIPTYIGGYAKPILYLYPEKETKVTITFDHPEKLTTTYPKYKDNWTVYAKPNGDLRDLNNKYYYGLYWEEDLNHRVNFDEGFYVTKDNAIDFLEEKLSIIGFNDRERNEFIMYWLPILEKNEKNLVYFELTQERNGYSKINITPKPDSMLRVAIHVKKVKERTTIKEQKLTQFNRTGFSAVEWGGVVY